MGKTGKPHLPAKSPGLPATPLSKQIPEIFRTQKPETTDAASVNMVPASSQSVDLGQEDPPTEHMQTAVPISDYLQHLPTRSELTNVASDIKNTLCSAVTELRKDIQDVGRRLHAVEKAGQLRDAEIATLHTQQTCTTHHLIDMRRHLEDLDNRGRRSNIRIRGLPESVLPTAIPSALCHIFNDLLDRSAESPIELVRAHRALRPGNAQDDMPRDVICCLQSFPLKEDILQRARSKDAVTYEGQEIHLFQDLSAITLQQRRVLRPLLDCLRDHGIQYRWRFPFCLSASHKGQTAMIRIPSEVPDFCTRLNIPQVSIPDWYADLQAPPKPTLQSSQLAIPRRSRSRKASSRQRSSDPNLLKNTKDMRREASSTSCGGDPRDSSSNDSTAS